jgi:ABC-type Fe3+/spermidine/putrescine transport system ATPase subunit
VSRWAVEGLHADAAQFHLGPVDLVVAEGETIAVLGRSGAGKTTFLRALAGFQSWRAGALRRDGEDLTRAPPERRGAVYVPQGLGLFPHRTVAGNVAYPFELAHAPAPTESAQPLLDRFGIGPLASRRPATLSTGEQQRVALARALAAKPQLLLWDEPLGALDVVARDELLSGLRSIRDEVRMPLIFVTHDPALAYSLADRWLVLDAGTVRYLGPPGPVLSAPPDLFSARFAGLENVYARATVTRASAGPFLSALHDAAGSEGVACASPRARSSEEAAGPYSATIERIEPSADGLRFSARCEGLSVRLRYDWPRRGPPPRPGDAVTFTLDGIRLAPVGPEPAGGGRPT